MNLKAIGVFGGTFDPVHNGHTEVIKILLDNFLFDHIRLIPCGKPPHKESTIGSSDQRIEMLKLAFKAFNNNIVLDRREIQKEGPSYAIETARELLDENSSDTSLVWIMGTDVFAEIDTWYRWEEFIEMINILVVSRPDIEIPSNSVAYKLLLNRWVDNFESLLNKRYGNIFFTNIKPVKISSTKVRDNLSLGEKVDDMIFSTVRTFIKRQKIYDKKNTNI